ncbi:MAG: hypothetical protein Q9216_000923 [Gyalolechia sp. 2 TL-2023]
MDLLRADGPGEAANGSNDAERPAIEPEPPSPMIPPFMTSAPGKVIVYGEHAVVYGKPAMAAAISLRSYLLTIALSKSHRTITLRFPDVDLEHTWNIDDLPWSTFAYPSKKKNYYDLVDRLDPELVEAMQPHLSTISPNATVEDRKVHQHAASAFLYLFLSLGSQKFPGCIYVLRSTIPIGAGLGSSASICVCLSSAILLQLRILSGPHPDQPREEAELQMERVNRWAFVGEMCIHGNPSGVDNTVATGGKAVVFKRGDHDRPPTVTPLRDFPELPLLLVNTRQSRSTSTEVAKVAAMRRAYPAVTESILEAISKITESAHELISSSGFDTDNHRSVKTLGDLMKINHGLLAALGVSHPKLERIRDIVDTVGMGYTKLTGAGGGGCAITLLSPNASPSTLKSLEDQLCDEGFERYETKLGGNGVGVLWPAVLHKGSGKEGGEAIDPEEFMKGDMIDVEGIVGLGISANDKQDGWRFWSDVGRPHGSSQGKQESIVGQALAAALVKENKVTSLTLTDIVEPAAPSSSKVEIRCVEADLTSQNVCDSLLRKELTHVFLLHGVMSGAAEADLELGIKVNIDATRQVLDTLRKVNPGVKVIFTSTTAVYGPPPSPGFPLTESNAPSPGSSYGAQKLIIETLLNDFSRRNLLDGRIVRLPTVLVRPGKPTGAASSFASGIFREPLNGQKSILPVSKDLSVWICSPRTVVKNLIHARDISAEKYKGGSRVVNLPGVTVSIHEMLAALKAVGGPKAIDLVEEKRDAATEKIVESWPAKYETSRAKDLGFTDDGTLEQTLQEYIEDYSIEKI